ncbi:MAG: hypothetical protein M1268_01430 [Patescibacteria group bacterium]|nr:hypothetical protein [Patescibacteria group bacterium]
MDNYDKHISRMLHIGRELVKKEPLLIKETGTVNAKGDRSIQMDLKIEEALINYIKENNLPVNIFSEEIGIIEFHPNPIGIIAFDPLDGSTNYKIGKSIFPYGLLIALYEGLRPKLNDVVSAGAIEYTQDLAWIYSDGKTTNVKGNPVSLKTNWEIKKSTPVYLDLYYKEGYKAYMPLAQKIFIRNQGSTIGNLSYVLSNIAACMGGVCMRPEEIGAVVALIKGAGGIAVNHKGKDLGGESFSPDKTYQILGGAKNIIKFAINQLNNNYPR